jgi:DNA-binding CsgD family transcriptional regulator
MAASMVEPAADPDLARSAVDVLARCPRTDDAMPALVAAIVALIHQQDWEQARSWCDRLLGEGPDQSAAWRAHLHAARAEARLRLDDTAGACADAEHALELLAPKRWGVRVGWPLSVLVMAACLAGDHDGAARHLATATPELMYETRYSLPYRYARGHYHLATGEYRPALADFLGCGRVTRRWQVDLSAYCPWQAAAAATYLAIGDYPAAAALIDEYRRTVEPRGRSAADLEATFDLLSRAADTATLARTITTIQRGGPPARPPGIARYKIHDRYSRCLAKLSRSEQRVAVLAARGLTNQCIARELSLTVSTVEQHLTRTYRKLDIAGRNELRAMLG